MDTGGEMSRDSEDHGGSGAQRDRTLDRRTVLKGAATGAVAATGFTAFSGTASAGSCIDLSDTDPPGDFPMIENGGTHGDFPSAPDEMTIFVHGWMEKLSGTAKGQAYVASEALTGQGYSHPVVGYKHDSNDPRWGEAKDTAEAEGADLADWLDSYMDAHPETDIRLVCHSLGARVSLKCLDVLRQRGKEVRSLSLLGAAVDSESVAEGGRWYEAASHGASYVYNFYSYDDGVLAYIYEIGDTLDDIDWDFDFDVEQQEALGAEGADGETPVNYTELDVTDSVSDHCQYFQPGEGCMDRVFLRMGKQTIPDGVYAVVNVNSWNVLDIEGTSTENNASALQWDWEDVAWQRWRVDHLGDGEYRIVNQHSEKVLDVENFSTENEGDIQQWSWHGASNQRFFIDDLGDGEHRIRSAYSGKMVDVVRASAENGANVQQWEWHGEDNQRWQFVRLE